MPSIISNVQKMVLKNQFKKAYSVFSQAVFQAQTNLGTAAECNYWLKYPYSPAICKEENEYGSCTKWTYSDGTPLHADHNGPMSNCAAFEEELFTKTLKVAKFCQDNALANGCLTKNYRGTDIARTERYPEDNPDPNAGFSDTNIKNKNSSWILADGTVIIKFGKYKNGTPVYTIDINGHKGPNKWGHDIFTFQLSGDYEGIKKITPATYWVEKGGFSTEKMIQMQ